MLGQLDMAILRYTIAVAVGLSIALRTSGDAVAGGGAEAYRHGEYRSL